MGGSWGERGTGKTPECLIYGIKPFLEEGYCTIALRSVKES